MKLTSLREFPLINQIDAQDGGHLPIDYFERVGRKGDTFRDGLTKRCLYLASYAEIAVNDYVLVVVEKGNQEALEAFEAQCRTPTDDGPSALQFSLATTSAAATSINIRYGARGGNLTLNGAEHGVVYGLLAAGQFLSNNPGAAAHMFWETIENEVEKIVYLRIVSDPAHFFSFSVSPIFGIEARASESHIAFIRTICEDGANTSMVITDNLTACYFSADNIPLGN